MMKYKCVCTMYRCVHTRLYLPLVLDTRCYPSFPTAQFADLVQNAMGLFTDHLPEPFLGSTSLYEPCMYRKADSCTQALYVGGSVKDVL
jgi:hypothetical protein